MANPVRKPMAGMSQGMPPGPGGLPGDTSGGDPIKDNASFMNPADLSLMQKEGGIQQGMTVRSFLEQQGIDVDGPIDQLTKFALKQTQNATMRGKAQNIAPAPAGPAGPPAGPAEQPGMASLLKGAM